MRSAYLFITMAILLGTACGKTDPTPADPLLTATPVLRTVKVASSTELQAALNAARPGDLISLADGTYTGEFSIPSGVNGTTANHIVLSGSRQAQLQTNSLGSGKPALYLAGNSYWEVRGFTVFNSKKGIVTDYSSHNVFDQLSIFRIGEEGIHFRRNSTYNVFQNSEIKTTGLDVPGYGEGCYIGSAKSNWPTYTDGQPDLSDYNTVQRNVFGPDIKAECIDVKEGTTGGTISDNTFNGAGMSGANYADSWMDVKGNGYTISGNKGSGSLLDGYQVHIAVPGWGQNNKFSNNTCDVQNSGYGFNIQKLDGTPNGNVVYANNKVTNAGSGVANILVTP